MFHLKFGRITGNPTSRTRCGTPTRSPSRVEIPFLIPHLIYHSTTAHWIELVRFDVSRRKMQVYIGCSEAQTFDEIHAKLDLNYEPDPDNPTSYFEREFGAGYIDPGSYEIYDRADFEGEEFSQDFVKTLFPFAPPTDLNLWSRDFAKLRSVFFVISDKVWTATESGGIEITDSIAKPKFEFEE